MLEGSGKRHRYVPITQPSDLDRAGLADLLAAARQAAISK